jgi:hypothetical protein
MMLSRWVSFGQVLVRSAIHLHPTPSDDATSYSALDERDRKYKNDIMSNNVDGDFDPVAKVSVYPH